jgi:hypothetical protein
MIGSRCVLLVALLAVMSAFALPAGWAVAQSEAAQLPEGFLGTWAGAAEQVSPTQSSTYETRIELTGGEQYATIGTVTYMGSNWTCGGSFVLWLVPDLNHVAVGEHITMGGDVCPNGGFIQFTLNDDGTLSYEWRLPGMLDVVAATLEPVAE